MSTGNKGLGRGLNALFDNTPAGNPAVSDSGTSPAVSTLPLSDIVANPHQPRRHFAPEAIAELAQSIRAQGIIQPLVVRPAPQGHKYQIVAGERRYRAAQQAGLLEVPVVVHAYSDEEVMLAALIENLQREDLNPVEEAQALASLKENLQLTQEELSAKLGKSRPAVANALRLLQLPAAALEDVQAGRLSAGHARALLSLDDEHAREALRTYVLQQQCPVRVAEEAATFWKQEGRFPWEKEEQGLSPAPRSRVKPEALKRLQSLLSSALSCKTQVSGTENKGKITLSYTSPEELHSLLTRLGMPQE